MAMKPPNELQSAYTAYHICCAALGTLAEYSSENRSRMTSEQWHAVATRYSELGKTLRSTVKRRPNMPGIIANLMLSAADAASNYSSVTAKERIARAKRPPWNS